MPVSVEPKVSSHATRRRLRKLNREFETSSWTEIFGVLSTIKRQDLWKEMGFDSFQELLDESASITALLERVLDTKRQAECDEYFLEAARMFQNVALGLPSTAAVANRPIEPGQRSAQQGWRRPMPPADQFACDPGVWDQMCFGIGEHRSVLLIGASGCGKTELVAWAVKQSGRTLERFSFAAMSEPRASLIGNTHFDAQRGTWFEKSRFVRAIETPGTCLLLDEVSRAGRDAFNLLLPVLDRQQYLALDEGENAPLVKCADNLSFLATANLGVEYTGASELDQAFLDRFSIVIRLDFPPIEKELAVLQGRCPGLPKAVCETLVKLADAQRQKAREGEFTSFVSTRSLLEAGHQLNRGIALPMAIEYCIVNRFSSDGGHLSDAARLRQLAAKFTG